MYIFENFFSQEWVRIATIFTYVVLLIYIPFLYVKTTKRLPEQFREKYIENCWELYGVLFFLSIAPVGYLVLYFFNSDSSFIDKDPLPWVCFLGGLGASFDYFRTRNQLTLAIKKNNNANRINTINAISKLSMLPAILGVIPLTYGTVMIALTNSSYLDKLPAMMWFWSFLITGLAIIYAVWSKGFLAVSQSYASNPNLAAIPHNKGVN